jgi:hypothetical protein
MKYNVYSDKKLEKIIYWYDRNIKLYTFQFLDIEGNELQEADYSSKKTLIKTKEMLYKEYGIKPEIYR